jgi:alkane 1-monooxygenase
LIGVTYLPWVWRRMMDHRVLEHYNGDITKVNIDPRRRAKILARYGADERLREENSGEAA